MTEEPPKMRRVTPEEIEEQRRIERRDRKEEKRFTTGDVIGGLFLFGLGLAILLPLAIGLWRWALR